MSITFSDSRDGPSIVSLTEAAVNAVNAACPNAHIDPYGDTKLLDSHIAQILALPADTIPADAHAAFEKLANLEVVYAFGN